MLKNKKIEVNHFADRTLFGSVKLEALEAAYIRNTGRTFVSPLLEDTSFSRDSIVDAIVRLLQQQDTCSRELWHSDFSVRKLEASHRESELNAQVVSGGLSDAPFTYGYRVVPRPDTNPIRNLLDPRYGMVTNIYRDLASTSDALVGAEFACRGERITAYGRGANFEAAERLCLLELVERHAMYTPRRPLLQSTLATMEAQYRVLRPEDILHYVEDSVPGSRHPFDPRSKVGWVSGVDLRKESEVWLPAQLAYLTVESEDAWAQETSNGVALGATNAEAQLFALTELVERDAFMTFWFGRQAPRKIDIASLPSSAHHRITQMTDSGVDVHVLDLSIFPGIAVIMVVILSSDSTVATFQSTAAHPHPAKALHNALDEALVGFRVYERNPEVPGSAIQPEDVTSLTDHVRWAAHRQQEHIYDWALSESNTVDFDHVTGAAKVPSCASAASARELLGSLLAGPLAELRCIGVDLSTPLSESIGCRVWRVISPDVSPMWFGYHNRRVNERALRTRLRATGGSSILPAPQEVPLVHPYA